MGEQSSEEQPLEHGAEEVGRLRRFVAKRPALSIGIAGVVAALFEAEIVAAALIGGAAMLAMTRRQGTLKEKLASTRDTIRSTMRSALDSLNRSEPVESPT